MHPRLRVVLVGTSLLVGLTACGGNEVVSHDLSFKGTGYTPHEGQDFHMAVVRADTGELVAKQSTTVTNGSFLFSLPDTLQEGVAYRLDYYADHNRNGQCDAPPSDHVWRTELSSVTQDVTLEDAHDTSFTGAACASF